MLIPDLNLNPFKPPMTPRPHQGCADGGNLHIEEDGDRRIVWCDGVDCDLRRIFDPTGELLDPLTGEWRRASDRPIGDDSELCSVSDCRRGFKHTKPVPMCGACKTRWVAWDKPDLKYFLAVAPPGCGRVNSKRVRAKLDELIAADIRRTEGPSQQESAETELSSARTLTDETGRVADTRLQASDGPELRPAKKRSPAQATRTPTSAAMDPPPAGLSGFEPYRRAQTTQRCPAGVAALHSDGWIAITDADRSAAGLDGQVGILMDADGRRIALRPPTPDDMQVAVRPDGPRYRVCLRGALRRMGIDPAEYSGRYRVAAQPGALIVDFSKKEPA